MYKVNERFVTDDCGSTCKCGEDGSVICVPLCPPMAVQCSPHERVENVNVPMGPGGKCSCQRQRCMPGKMMRTSISELC